MSKTNAQIEQLINTLLNHPNVTKRRLAATELKNFKDNKAINTLIRSLSDHEDVAIFSMLSLLEIGKDAIPELRKGLKSPNEQIRGYSAEILGELKAEEAIEDLIEIIEKEKNVWVRNNAVEAIGRMNNPRSIEILRKLLKDKDNSIVISASLALQRMGIQKDLYNILIDRLFNEPEIERGLIAWALIEICDKSHLNQFQELLNSHQNSDLTSVLNEIIIGISSK